MKFIMNGLKYDTEKSTLIADTGIIWEGVEVAFPKRWCIYQTQNGRLFLARQRYREKRVSLLKTELIPEAMEYDFSLYTQEDIIKMLIEYGFVGEAEKAMSQYKEA